MTQQTHDTVVQVPVPITKRLAAATAGDRESYVESDRVAD